MADQEKIPRFAVKSYLNSDTALLSDSNPPNHRVFGISFCSIVQVYFQKGSIGFRLLTDDGVIATDIIAAFRTPRWFWSSHLIPQQVSISLLNICTTLQLRKIYLRNSNSPLVGDSEGADYIKYGGGVRG